MRGNGIITKMRPLSGPTAPARNLARLLGTLLSLLIQADAWSHPVAQGAMDLVVHPDRVDARVWVSTEEVFVASSLSTHASAPADADVLWKGHGAYLLEHLHLWVDGHLLTGRVVRCFPPGEGETRDGATADGVVYDLEFSGVSPDPAPLTLRVEEDVLAEFNFAAGNPWTASYVVSVDHPGHAGIVRGLLLDRRQPLSVDLGPRDAEKTTPSLPPARIIQDYFFHGLFHIYTGYDHLLFMCALALGAVSLWDLVKVVTAFTAAHSLTLTLSVLNLLRLPDRLVEPLIAASIVAVAIQNVLAPRQSRGMWRIGAAFFFGLFHGLGFAGGLLEAMAGLPPVAIGLAILGFSLGVETAQQSVVVPVFATMRGLKRRPGNPSPLPKILARSLSALIAGLGTVYLFQALAA